MVLCIHQAGELRGKEIPHAASPVTSLTGGSGSKAQGLCVILSKPEVWALHCADELRLVNGSSPCAGRVEVKHQDRWGTVCDNNWDMEDAEVVCKQLGCGSAVSAHGQAYFGEGSGPTWLILANCDGDESALWDCTHEGWGAFQCYHSFDTGVICSGLIEVRLVGGDTACSGRTVCDSHLDFNTASVICNELGCGQAVATLGATHFGEGHDLIWKEEFQCVGNESLLQKCPRMSHPNGTCSHANDVGILCSGYSGYRLANGSTRCSGRVELRHGGTWGTLCDSQWDLQGAHTLCQQNDCGFALSIPSEQLFGTGDGYVWNGTFGCERNESRLRDCPVTALGTTECPPGNEASVVCSGEQLQWERKELGIGEHPQPVLHSVSIGQAPLVSMRLLNGTECSGRVEIRHGDTWGSLCASHWDLQDANVLCHQLNCGYAKSIQGGAHFGEGNGTIWSDTFHCEGTESCLWNCSRMALGNPACSPRDTARVICRSEALRLLYGESRCNGTVEIFLHGMWSRVLDDQWDMRDASVVCRQLQCGVAEKAYNPSKSERGRGPVGLRRVQCAGNETRLTLCDNSVSETAQLGSIPAGSMQIRLVNGTGRCAGRVEIYYNGSWGTVCDDFWDLSDSNVVCKQLGCGHAINATISAHYGEGSGQIWLDDVNCSGNESELWECPSRVWGHNCDHKEDVGVNCSGDPSCYPEPPSCADELRLMNGSNPCSGRVEVKHHNWWGTACGGNWNMKGAVVVCKQLGCGSALKALNKAPFGKGSGPTWLYRVNCHGNESALWDCSHRGWGSFSCKHEYDIGVICSGKMREKAMNPKCVTFLNTHSWTVPFINRWWDLWRPKPIAHQSTSYSSSRRQQKQATSSHQFTSVADTHLPKKNERSSVLCRCPTAQTSQIHNAAEMSAVSPPSKKLSNIAIPRTIRPPRDPLDQPRSHTPRRSSNHELRIPYPTHMQRSKSLNT
uniref:SRCR domain-containing protein n=1 Tax=Chelonoidis abingdonii TaxID=106734 RepID=A0A8C0HC59_CHEAB